MPLDVTDPDSVKGCAERVTDELGDIEVLVAGAGDTYFGKLDAISTDEFESQIQIHLIGANRVADRGAARHDRTANAATSSSSGPTSRCASVRTWAPTALRRRRLSRW